MRMDLMVYVCPRFRLAPVFSRSIPRRLRTLRGGEQLHHVAFTHATPSTPQFACQGPRELAELAPTVRSTLDSFFVSSTAQGGQRHATFLFLACQSVLSFFGHIFLIYGYDLFIFEHLHRLFLLVQFNLTFFIQLRWSVFSRYYRA